MSAATALDFREGEAGDLRATFAVSASAVHDTATRLGVLRGPPPTETQVESEWQAQREVVEFLAGEPHGSYWVCEDGGRIVGYARVCRFADVEQLTELMVLPSHHRRGIGGSLLERCWSQSPSDVRLRLVLAAGAPADLTLYARFGVMPISGHWHVRAATGDFRDARVGAYTPDLTSLQPEAAVASWERLEAPAIGRSRSVLHQFLARSRECLALIDDGAVRGLCWVGPGTDVGPAVAVTPGELVPTVLGALDHAARRAGLAHVGVYCATASWGLIEALLQAGFRVHWPGWIMASAPLPGLDRYLPMRPPHLL